MRKMLVVWASGADGETRLVSIYLEIRATVEFPAGLGGDRRVEKRGVRKDYKCFT